MNDLLLAHYSTSYPSSTVVAVVVSTFQIQPGNLWYSNTSKRLWARPQDAGRRGILHHGSRFSFVFLNRVNGIQCGSGLGRFDFVVIELELQYNLVVAWSRRVTETKIYFSPSVRFYLNDGPMMMMIDVWMVVAMVMVADG
ncbi:hypothetical protein TWF506_011492 [Arthrobotrys conoides]|uniref:Uncharacterized protein n=1 Tax=Arthrobotrys conoides TaxID=74498 RepID=A0AAN8RZ73_9PEZI